MKPGEDLTIVTTVTEQYVKWLPEWAQSISRQLVRPATIVIVGNGLSRRGRGLSREAIAQSGMAGCFVDQPFCPIGHAMNVAVEHTSTEWVMLLGADDVILPDALEQIAAVADEADVVQLNFHVWSDAAHGNQLRLYAPLDGAEALEANRIASGPSPFRRSFWMRWRFPEELLASWDYGLWLGFAHLGARFRPTARAAFRYRWHTDSHWHRVGVHHHDDLIALRRRLEADFPAAQTMNLILAATP